MKKLTLPNGDIISYIDKLTALDVYEEIYVENEYLRHGIQIKNKDVIFDIGANIGLFSRFMTTQAKDLRIYTFEPVPVIFRILEENLRNLPAQVKNYNIGLAETNKDAKINYYPKVSADSAIIPFDWDLKVNQYVDNYDEIIVKENPVAKIVPKFLRKRVVRIGLKNLYKAEIIDCKLRPLTDLIKENEIDIINLMKIDAENYEYQVLAGIKNNDWDKIQQITMEVHEHIEGGENLLNTLAEMLEDKGFQVVKGLDGRFSSMGVYMLYAKRL